MSYAAQHWILYVPGGTGDIICRPALNIERAWRRG
jgi:hypothetical protein